MDTAQKIKNENGKRSFRGAALALAVCIALAVWFFHGEKETPMIQPGEYRAEEILYSTIATIPDREIVQDLFACRVKEDDRLLIKQLYENGDSSQWISLGKLEPSGLSNENLGELIRLPNTWLSGSPEDIGTITDARAVTHRESDYLLFCTEDGGCYFAKCSQMGEDRVTYVSYLARLEGPEAAGK